VVAEEASGKKADVDAELSKLSSKAALSKMAFTIGMVSSDAVAGARRIKGHTLPWSGHKVSECPQTTIAQDSLRTMDRSGGIVRATSGYGRVSA